MLGPRSEGSFAVLLRSDDQGFGPARTAVKAERSEFIGSLDSGLTAGRTKKFQSEGGQHSCRFALFRQAMHIQITSRAPLRASYVAQARRSQHQS